MQGTFKARMEANSLVEVEELSLCFSTSSILFGCLPLIHLCSTHEDVGHLPVLFFVL